MGFNSGFKGLKQFMYMDVQNGKVETRFSIWRSCDRASC